MNEVPNGTLRSATEPHWHLSLIDSGISYLRRAKEIPLPRPWVEREDNFFDLFSTRRIGVSTISLTNRRKGIDDETIHIGYTRRVESGSTSENVRLLSPCTNRNREWHQGCQSAPSNTDTYRANDKRSLTRTHQTTQLTMQ